MIFLHLHMITQNQSEMTRNIAIVAMPLRVDIILLGQSSHASPLCPANPIHGSQRVSSEIIRHFLDLLTGRLVQRSHVHLPAELLVGQFEAPQLKLVRIEFWDGVFGVDSVAQWNSFDGVQPGGHEKNAHEEDCVVEFVHEQLLANDTHELQELQKQGEDECKERLVLHESLVVPIKQCDMIRRENMSFLGKFNLLLDPVTCKNVNKTYAKETYCHVEGYDAPLK